MDLEDIYNELAKYISKDRILKNELMSKHTSFKVGGPADIFIIIENLEELSNFIKIVNNNNIKYKVFGNGSNIIVKDEGYRGVIVKLNMCKFEIVSYDNYVIVKAEAGAKNAILAQKLLQNEITGFEFASGIPGTIGGAVAMNAGAHKNEIKDIVYSVTYMNENGEIKTILNKDCKFEYRNSLFKSKKSIILSTELKLNKGSKENIKCKMDEYKNYRVNNQPIEFPNAGSTFKRGTDFITAKLIDEAGLKGYSIGGAEVSTKHAGFIINKGNAKAKDIIELIQVVQKKVYDKYQKKIELEVEII